MELTASESNHQTKLFLIIGGSFCETCWFWFSVSPWKYKSFVANTKQTSLSNEAVCILKILLGAIHNLVPLEKL